MRMTGGGAIADGLLAHGIDTVFGLPGVQVYGLFDALALRKDRIRLIHARHEQTVAHMALGYACATGRPSVYSVVPGPGVMNTAAALLTAWSLNAPVLCLTGQVPSHLIGRGRGQLHEMPDQLGTLRSLVKWADRIEHPSSAPHLVARAFQEMTSGRTGPVSLEMAWDQFSAMGDGAPCMPLPCHPVPAPEPEAVEALSELIAKSKAPMIWVGGGALHSGLEIKQLAERIGAPVVSHRRGRGILDDRHPLSINIVAAHRLWPETDLLIGIGTRLDISLGRWPRSPPGLKTARIDIDPAEMRRLKVDLGIVADSKRATSALVEAISRRPADDWLSKIATARADADRIVRTLQPQMSFLDAIREVLPEDGILCDEMTQVGYVSWVGFPTYAPRTLITSGFAGTLGAGFPMALGVKVAHPDRAVVSVTGDGGFLFAGAELATAVQHNINLVTVLFNNSAYGNVQRDQRAIYQGRDAGVSLVNPDFQAFARAFGVRSWQTNDARGLKSALREALDAGAPALIEVSTDIEAEANPWPILVPGRA